MKDISILIGGKAGEGINQAGLLVARVLSRMGYKIYVYYDYPSLIRGGHNFSVIRASREKIAAQGNKIDILLALNQDAVDLHKDRLKEDSIVIYDSDLVKASGTGVALGTMVKEEKAPVIMRNSGIIGAFCKAIGVEKNILEDIFRKHVGKETELNIKIALRGYDQAGERLKIEKFSDADLPVISGNEAIGLGLIKAGLKSYVAYPMTPASSILHVLAGLAKEFSLKVVHPENEIAVILMALGFAYAGEKVAVGTSGGGFCLMTEGLSFSGMAELPVVVVVSQRPGPSTGVPTYTAQADLNFVLSAGQGEFVRFVTAPGDADEAYFWSQVALNMAWKWQIPCIVLVDKTLSEGSFSFDLEAIEPLGVEGPLMWDGQKDAGNNMPDNGNEENKSGDDVKLGKEVYKRYLNTPDGVSPLGFVPFKGEVIKVNSYAHDECGITTEDVQEIKNGQDKLLRKEGYLAQDLELYDQVRVYGNADARMAVLCWGSNKGVCVEVAEKLGLKVVQPIVLCPFPLKQFKEALAGVEKLICVETNATAQLAGLVGSYGFNVDEKILKYDGRPFVLDELEEILAGFCLEEKNKKQKDEDA